MIAQQAGAPLRVVVVGGGLAGLSAACTAAARGHQVTLLDKNDWVGGKAAQHTAAGYRFDMGPTILTLPGVLKRVFAEAGRELQDYLELVPLDPQWRCFFEGDTPSQNVVLDLVADVAAMKQNLDAFTGSSHSSAGYEKFIGISEQLHGVSDRFFFWKSVGGLRDTMQIGGAFSAAVLKDVLSLRMGRSVAEVVRSQVPDQRVAQMMDHFTQYVGSSPLASPAVLCGIAHMQTQEGIWYPIGGTRAVPEALEKLAEELGVEIRTGCDVQQIATETQAGVTRVVGVTLVDGERIECDAVISNCDAIRTYRELLAGTPSASRFAKQYPKAEPACSGVVLYLGLNRRYDQLLHHNFIFSRDPEEEFDYIYRRGEPAPIQPPTSAPGDQRAGGRARRLRSAVRARAHAVLAPWSRLAGDVAAVPRSDPRQAGADRGAGRDSRVDRLRSVAHTRRDSSPLPRAQRSDLRAGEPRQVPWRV